MKLFSEKIPDLKALYFRHIRRLLSAEETFVRGLQRMAETASDSQLKQAFRGHGLETEKHQSRLHQILQSEATGETHRVQCKVASDLMDETEDSIVDSAHEAVRDAALIAAAQRVEHYEIAAYGAVVHFARVLGLEGDAKLLNETLQEEAHADHLLSQIAERVNPAARKVA